MIAEDQDKIDHKSIPMSIVLEKCMDNIQPTFQALETMLVDHIEHLQR